MAAKKKKTDPTVILDAPTPIGSPVTPAVSTPSRQLQDPTVGLPMAERLAFEQAQAKKNASLYRAAAMNEGGALEGIPIGQGAGGGFLTLGGVIMRLMERNQRMKAAEEAAQQYEPSAGKRAQLANAIDALNANPYKYKLSDYQVNNIPIGSPLSLGSQ